ncbi:MAG: hypothetical protein DRI44_04670 [Chlamydiae bacterium]|nr:MAG: hypothetical protein DRI44_04670 [Chlamydiota bacterium]
MCPDFYESKLQWTSKRSDMHYLRVSTSLARSPLYPFRPDDKIACTTDGKFLIFCKDEDKDELMKILNGEKSIPTFKKLIEEEIYDDIYEEI